MRDEKRVIRILLVEDDPMVQEVNRMFIDKIDGFSVIGVASSGVMGRQQIEKLKPDLVLLDVYMPGKDGVELIKQLRQELVDVDIIAVTAANDTNTVKTLLRHGVVDYVVKPFTFERLEKALTQYKNVYGQLNHNDKVSQEKLDHVLVQQTRKQDVTLPKGLHAHTLNQIHGYLKDMKSAKSAEEIGNDVGLARVTVRRYLNYLESIGQVEMELTYGTIGRPIQLYSLKQ
ncbi:response regulator [Alkalihalobacterium alkalinitrilicum]|uniref:response regulator n=1 Tax=Alkalihalobacterium alkalinitrilicum TaxID=427920 RepID=UPI00099584DA|nr:response regulator [Alkalihalobacterium alkalinitrilicum]